MSAVRRAGQSLLDVLERGTIGEIYEAAIGLRAALAVPAEPCPLEAAHSHLNVLLSNRRAGEK